MTQTDRGRNFPPLVVCAKAQKKGRCKGNDNARTVENAQADRKGERPQVAGMETERGQGIMNKREMKTVSDGDLIVEYVKTAAEESSNFVLDRGIVLIQRHRKAVEQELLKRGILNERQIKRANFEN